MVRPHFWDLHTPQTKHLCYDNKAAAILVIVRWEWKIGLQK